MTSSRPLRLGIPAWTFVPGGMGGTETYARELLAALSRHPEVEVTAFVNRAAAGVLAADHEVVASRVRGGDSAQQRIASLGRGLLPDARCRASLRSQDVLHYPFTVPLPRVGGVPWITSLNDVQHLDLPHLFTRAERAYRRVAYDLPARRAPLVITLSEFCRERIVEHLAIPADRVVVTHLGVDTSAFTSYAGPREQFVLYPATAWQHKNHARLIRAMERVRHAVPHTRLVLTGGRLDSLGELPDWVERRGHVPASELQALYRAAACMVFPSLYEGFGLPVLEAMASGCPVAASNRGSLPEICGDAATLFDPEDEEAMAEGIQTTLRRGVELTTRGTLRAEAFTWHRSAETHIEAYERAAQLATS